MTNNNVLQFHGVLYPNLTTMLNSMVEEFYSNSSDADLESILDSYKMPMTDVVLSETYNIINHWNLNKEKQYLDGTVSPSHMEACGYNFDDLYRAMNSFWQNFVNNRIGDVQ